MNRPQWLLKSAIWIPAAFCAALSYNKLFSPDGSGDPAFYSFLPMCFVLAATVQLALQKRIEILETALGENLAQARRARGDPSAGVD